MNVLIEGGIDAFDGDRSFWTGSRDGPPTREVIHEPLHPYTKALVSAISVPAPDIKRKGIRLDGEIPDPIDLSGECQPHPR